ncbi:MAG: hypothetical protein GX640_15325 [Fibrobacter sp.]|nr:hypothetical protein [Fibrobacter sp.]
MNKRYSDDFKSKFRYENGYYLIELRLSSLEQFFNTFDPSPFHDKDIDEDAEHYIVDTVRAFPIKTKLKLVFYLREEHQKEASKILLKAIENYFGYRAMMSSRELRSLLHEGRIALLMGCVFLVICIGARAALSFVEKYPLGNILLEGLSIIGWVAMWKPVHVFLYDWWAVYRMKKVYEKIRDMSIEICID